MTSLARWVSRTCRSIRVLASNTFVKNYPCLNHNLGQAVALSSGRLRRDFKASLGTWANPTILKKKLFLTGLGHV